MKASMKPAQKAAPVTKDSKDSKDSKKGSKLAHLKSALLGAAKKKLGGTAPSKSVAAPAKSARASASHSKDMKAADKASSKKSVHASAKPAASSSTGKKSAASAQAKASAGGKAGSAPAAAAAPKASAAPVVAAKPAPAAKPAKKGRGGKKQEIVPRERMAGPSIRVSYDANGDAVCREVACEGLSTANGYCRLHYIKNWKKIKRKEVILKEGKLNQYIEELVNKYPDKYIEAIREDLANDKDFAKVIYDLDLDESVDDFDGEGENLDGIVGDIKRDFESEDESGF